MPNTTQPRNAYALSWDYGAGVTTTNNRGKTYAVCTPRQFPSREARDTWVSNGNGDGLNREAATLSKLPYGRSRQRFTGAAAEYENLLVELEDEDEDEAAENAV